MSTQPTTPFTDPVSDRKSPGPSFKSELAQLIHKWSMDSRSDTPDYILAGFLRGCLHCWDTAISQRTKATEPPPPIRGAFGLASRPDLLDEILGTGDAPFRTDQQLIASDGTGRRGYLAGRCYGCDKVLFECTVYHRDSQTWCRACEGETDDVPYFMP